jgi:hypothetical protein
VKVGIFHCKRTHSSFVSYHTKIYPFYLMVSWIKYKTSTHLSYMYHTKLIKLSMNENRTVQWKTCTKIHNCTIMEMIIFQYHIIISQLSDDNLIRCYIIYNSELKIYDAAGSTTRLRKKEIVMPDKNCE